MKKKDMGKTKKEPYVVSFDRHKAITGSELHEFNSDFITRYSSRLSRGENLSVLYDFELDCLCEGILPFRIDCRYTNSAGIGVTVRGRGEGYVVVEYENVLYESDSQWIEDGKEVIVVSDIMFWSDQNDTSERNVNGK